jgi:hypothetical protein
MLIAKRRRFIAALQPTLFLVSALSLHAQSSSATKSTAQAPQSSQAPESRQPTEALSPRARDEAEIRSEQRFLEPDPPALQFSIINDETPGTNGKTSDCTPMERAGVTGFISCTLTFTRRGKRETHRVLRPPRFPEGYFLQVSNSIGMWEEMKDGMVQLFTLHTDGRVEIGAKVPRPHSVH